MIRRPSLPPEQRCKRTRCIKRAVFEGLCLRHASKKPLLNVRGGLGGTAPERARRQELQLLVQVGAITNLREQVPFRIAIETIWHADFVYERDGKTIAEDTKAGLISDRHRQCMKAMKKDHPEVEVREIDMRERGGKARRIR